MSKVFLRKYFVYSIPSLISLVLTTLLVSCGGGSSDSSSTPTAITGSYSDAGAVSGLQYSTATQSGTTDSSGKFLYLPGETVTFSVGSIVIGKAVAAPTLTTFDLVGISAPLTSLGIPNNIPSSLLFQQAINISTFLQTLDSDGNVSNGISIPSQAIVLAKNTAVNFNQKYFYFQNSFALNNFIGRCRTAGIWGGSRVIVSSGYAANAAILCPGTSISGMMVKNLSWPYFTNSLMSSCV